MSSANRHQKATSSSASTPTGTPCAAAAPLFSSSRVCSLKNIYGIFYSNNITGMFLAATKLCHAASPAPQPHPELLRATPRCPLLSPDTRMCHGDVPREFHPWEEVAGGCPAPRHGQGSAGPLLRDAEMLWQSPWQPRYTARRTKLPGEKRGKGREKEGGVEGKKAGRANSHGAKAGAGGSHGEGQQQRWEMELPRGCSPWDDLQHNHPPSAPLRHFLAAPLSQQRSLLSPCHFPAWQPQHVPLWCRR